jgi:hypothetical protein
VHHPTRPAAESSAIRRVRRIVRCLDVDLIARQVAPGFPAAPVGRIGLESDQAASWESMIRQNAELISHWMVCGNEPGEYALSELYEAARAAAGNGLAAEGCLPRVQRDGASPVGHAAEVRAP